MFGWLEIGIKFVKTLAGQWGDKSGPNAPRKPANGSMGGSASGADRITARPESQINNSAEDSPNSQQELGHCDLTFGAESIVVVQPESQIDTKIETSPNGQELARRREIMRQIFNDFWSSRDEKPGTFAERLNQAEDYINERLTACGEPWLLDSATRSQLGLPPQSTSRRMNAQPSDFTAAV